MQDPTKPDGTPKKLVDVSRESTPWGGARDRPARWDRDDLRLVSLARRLRPDAVTPRATARRQSSVADRAARPSTRTDRSPTSCEKFTPKLPALTCSSIDDGSTDDTAAWRADAGAPSRDLPFNLGVGGAMRTGFRYALDRGYRPSYRWTPTGSTIP